MTDEIVTPLEERWKDQQLTIITPQCHNCKHYFAGTLSCAAFFPINIPDEILMNDFDHTEEYPGDEGVLFEAGTPVAAPE